MAQHLSRGLVVVVALTAACSLSTNPTDGATGDVPVDDRAHPDLATAHDVLDASAPDAAPHDAEDRRPPPDDLADDRAMDVRDAGDVTDVTDAATPDVVTDAEPVDPLAGRAMVERVRTGFMFTEGPQWRSREGDLLFSDIPANTIFRLDGAGEVTTFRRPSDNSNGLAVDAMGRLLAAQHGSRSVTRTLLDGTRETLASTFAEGGERQRLNSPNDLIVRSDGTVYFTDPPYGISTGQQELRFNGVFRLSPSGALTAEWRGSRDSRPNGVALSPDERVLYVADTAAGTVRAWDVLPDGALTRERVAARTSGNPDGMAVDRAGNLYVTTRTGVQVFAPTGREWGVIAVPEQPANCAFGGADARTLYVTARTSLYRVRLANPGLY